MTSRRSIRVPHSLAASLVCASIVAACAEGVADDGAVGFSDLPTLLGPGRVLVLCHPTYRGARCNDWNAAVDYNGDDRIALFFDTNRNGAIDRGTDAMLDAIGRLGFSPPTGVAPPSSAEPWGNVDLRRRACDGFSGGRDFDVDALYDAFDRSDVSHLGVAPSLACP